MNNFGKRYSKTFVVFVVVSLLFFALMPLGASAASAPAQAKGDVTINFYSDDSTGGGSGGGGGTGGRRPDVSTPINVDSITSFGGEGVKGETVYTTQPSGQYPSTPLPKTGSSYLPIGLLVVIALASTTVYVLSNKKTEDLLKGGESQ